MTCTSSYLGTAAVALGASAALLLSGTAAQAATPVSLKAAVPNAAATPGVEHHTRVHHRAMPRIAGNWATAWNTGDGAAMGSLFTHDGVYTDHAFGASFTGPKGVAHWVAITGQSIADAHVAVRCAFRHGDTITVFSTFSGHIIGAPTAFSVPMVTVIQLSGGKIRSNDDYYDIAEVKRQSGLPADFDFSA